MSTFDNTLVHGIHKSRYVASWINSGGRFVDDRGLRQKYEFVEWLEALEIDGTHLTEDEIYEICNYATNGKLELELLAKSFINKLKAAE